MHRKYAKDGLAAVSVSLDDPADEAVKANVMKFLQKQQATFPNLILDAKPEVWQEKLRIGGPPAVFVFNREGRWKTFEPGFEYADVEKVAVEFLKRK